MAREIPEVVRAAAGLAATVLDEARKLPETLPGLPVRVIGLAMQSGDEDPAAVRRASSPAATSCSPACAARTSRAWPPSTTTSEPAAVAANGFRESAFDRAERPSSPTERRGAPTDPSPRSLARGRRPRRSRPLDGSREAPDTEDDPRRDRRSTSSSTQAPTLEETAPAAAEPAEGGRSPRTKAQPRHELSAADTLRRRADGADVATTVDVLTADGRRRHRRGHRHRRGRRRPRGAAPSTDRRRDRRPAADADAVGTSTPPPA